MWQNAPRATSPATRTPRNGAQSQGLEGGGWHGSCVSSEEFKPGAEGGPGWVRMKGNEEDRRKVRGADVVVTLLDRFLSQMRPWVIIGTFLVICLVVYAIAYVMKRAS